MKNNKLVLYIIIGLVVIVGVVWVVVGRSSSNKTTNGTQVAAESTSVSPMSLKTLFASGASQKCTFNSVNPDGSNTSGTVYVTAGHMRGDFTSTQQSSGKTVASHMITDGTTSYVWIDQPAEGFKMSFASMTSTSTGSMQNMQSGSVDPNQQMNYSCSGWSPDQSEFTLPTNITFNDMAAMMQSAAAANANMGVGTNNDSAACSGCDQAPAAYQAQCRATLGCK